MSSTALITISFFGIISTIILLLALLTPIPRKIGFRNIRRRLGNTALVVIGSMVGTALISGSLVLSDSLDKTFLNLVEEQIGETDLIITPEQKQILETNFAYINQNELEQIESALNTDEVDGVLPVLSFGVSPVKLNDEGEKVITAYQVEINGVDFNKVSEFGEVSEEINKPEKLEGVIISEDLAAELEAKTGDSLQVKVAGQEINLEVEQIVEAIGLVGSKSIIVQNKYLLNQLNFEQEIYSRILVSAKGGTVPEDYEGEEFEETINTTLGSFESERISLATQEIKQDAIDGFGLKIFIDIFLVLSLFGVASGILLIVNLYSMLASERKMEMGILRAIALTRRKLALSFTYEGFVYSVLAALVGTFVGVGIGYLLVVAWREMFQGAFDLVGTGFEFKFGVTAQSLVLAFSIGSIITLVTAAAASIKISNLNIVEAIRNVKPEKKKKLGCRWIIVTLLLTGIFLNSLVSFMLSFGVDQALDEQRNSESFADMSNKMFEDIKFVTQGYLFYVGLVAAVLIGVVLLNRIVGDIFKKKIDRFTITVASIGLIAFNVFLEEFDFLAKALNTDYGIGIFFLVGLVLVISSALIVTYNMQFISNAAARVFAPLRKVGPIFKIGLRYPAENASRTGITLVMFAIIVYLVGFVSIEKAAINDFSQSILDKSLNGYDVIVIPADLTTQEIVTIQEDISKVEGVEDVETSTETQVILPAYTYGELPESPYFGDTSEQPDYDDDDKFQTRINSLTPDLLRSSEVELGEYLDRYETPEAVWEALISEDNKVVLGSAFVSQGFGKRPEIEIGETIQVADLFNQAVIEKEVIAKIAKDDFGAGLSYGLYQNIVTSTKDVQNDFSEEYRSQLSSTNIVVKLEGNENGEVVNAIKRAIIDYNILIVLDVEEVGGVQIGFLNSMMLMLQGFLAFSLIVGTSGLAIILVRSVNERRQQIGMLRSLGFQRRMILASFFVEATFITFMGIVIGISMGIISAQSLFAIAEEQNAEIKFIIPWGEILIISLLIYIASIIFSFLPSIKAANLSPVEATNYPE